MKQKTESKSKALTWKEVGYEILVSPATVLSGISSLLFGSNKRTKNDGYEKDVYGNEKINNGILGSILDGVKYVGRAVSNFLHDHKKAIATAFWASLVLAGAAALTVFLWPAALAAVTTFTVAGFSIAGVVGANVALQIGAVAALTTVATSAAVYTVAAIANTINFFIKCCAPKKPGSSDGFTETNGAEVLKANGSAQRLRGLGSRTQADLRSTTEPTLEKPPLVAPVHAASPLDRRPTPVPVFDKGDEKSAAPAVAAL